MKEQLIETLSTFGYPVRLQGSIGEDEPYPNTFFTFWNNASDDGSHYDNEPINYIWDFTINLYSTDPVIVNTVLLEAKKKLRKQGWIIGGKGYDVPSDEKSHTGRAIDALYIENEGVKNEYTE